MRKIPVLSVLLILSFVFLYSLRVDHPAPDMIRRYLVKYGSIETGAANLVTSIYLGYRAFDTLGETIVLLVSVAGVVFVIRADND